MKVLNIRTIIQILLFFLLISCNNKSNNYYNCPIQLETIGFFNSICEIEEMQKNDRMLASFSKYGIFVDSSKFKNKNPEEIIEITKEQFNLKEIMFISKTIKDNRVLIGLLTIFEYRKNINLGISFCFDTTKYIQLDSSFKLGAQYNNKKRELFDLIEDVKHFIVNQSICSLEGKLEDSLKIK